MPSRPTRLQKRILARVLREAREEAELRQADLAKKLGQPQSFVSKYEVGERRLDVLELRLICAALGITTIDLVNRLERALRTPRDA